MILFTTITPYADTIVVHWPVNRSHWPTQFQFLCLIHVSASKLLRLFCLLCVLPPILLLYPAGHPQEVWVWFWLEQKRNKDELNWFLVFVSRSDQLFFFFFFFTNKPELLCMEYDTVFCCSAMINLSLWCWCGSGWQLTQMFRWWRCFLSSLWQVWSITPCWSPYRSAGAGPVGFLSQHRAVRSILSTQRPRPSAVFLIFCNRSS